jgi:hypothetical protein
VRDLHALNAVILIGANLLAFGWGLYYVLRKRPPGRIYAHALALSQALLIAQVALGLLLLSDGRRVADDLHYLYGVLSLLSWRRPSQCAPTPPLKEGLDET